MSDNITLTGTIGTEPVYRKLGTNSELARLTFRVATSERRQTANGQWEDAHTNWYSVTAFGRLADNANGALHKGERVILTGKLRINEYTRKDGSQGMSAELVASHLGRDLAYSAKARTMQNQPEVSDAAVGQLGRDVAEPAVQIAPDYEVAAPF